MRFVFSDLQTCLESDPEWLDAQVLAVTAVPNANRLESIAKYAAILSAFVAMAVGIAQYRRGVSQSIRELEWKQADMARRDSSS